MLSLELKEALEDVALAYGWKNTRKLWFETRGFVTSLATAMADYPKSGLISDEALMQAVNKLKDFPDPHDDVRHTLNAELDGDMPASAGEDMDGLINIYGEEAVRELLWKQAEEQRCEDLKNSRDYEYIEARVAKNNGAECCV